MSAWSRNSRILAAFGVVFVLGLALGVGELRACMVCVADPLESVLVRELQGSDEVALAQAAGDRNEGRYEIIKILKSAAGVKVGELVDAKLPLFSVDGGKIGREIVLVTRRSVEEPWFLRGPAADLFQTTFYGDVLLQPLAGGLDVLDEINRILFFVGYLHHEDVILAKAAAAELAKVPYGSMKKVRTRLDPQKIRAELAKQGELGRRTLFYTLLGLCGEEQDQSAIREGMESMWQGHGARNLGALLTAYLELEGEAGVAEIERRYFRDQERTLPEIEEAIMALRVHGNTDDRISRERVIASYQSLFEDREVLMFLVAADLARWKDWESKERLIDLDRRRGDDIPEIRRSVEQYLVQCPE